MFYIHCIHWQFLFITFIVERPWNPTLALNDLHDLLLVSDLVAYFSKRGRGQQFLVGLFDSVLWSLSFLNWRRSEVGSCERTREERLLRCGPLCCSNTKASEQPFPCDPPLCLDQAFPCDPPLCLDQAFPWAGCCQGLSTKGHYGNIKLETNMGSSLGESEVPGRKLCMPVTLF